MKRTRKILSSLISIAMLCAFAVPMGAAAQDSIDFTKLQDYIPGEVPANLILQPGKADIVATITAANVFDAASVGWINGKGFGGYKLVVKDTLNKTQSWRGYLNGFELLCDDKAFASGTTLKAGGSYVFAAAVRNAGTTEKCSINAALSNSKAYPTGVYSAEYGKAGMEVSDKENWTDFKGTFIMPGEADTQQPPKFTIGYPNETEVGSGVEVNLNNPDVQQMYFAEEAAYDINVKSPSDKEAFLKGSEAEFEASVINQIGNKGNLDQSFEWYVLNTDRTEEAAGIAVTPSADAGFATVSITTAAQAGEYVVAAFSDRYQMAKGIKIKVVDPSDYVPGEKPANLIADPGREGSLGTNNSGDVSTGCPKDESDNPIYSQWQFAANKAFTSVSMWGAAGQNLRNNGAPGIPSDFTAEAGKTYVYCVSAKTGAGNPKMNFAYVKSYCPYFTNEYGESGAALGSEWQNFAASVTIPEGKAGGNIFAIGLSSAEEAGDKVIIKLATQYFAEEEAYDISVTNQSNKRTVSEGETVTLDAQITNQIGTKGGLKQNFEWYALSSDRTEEAAGITVTPSVDTASATVNADNAKAGTYTIVAVSDDYRMSKGYTITKEAYDVTKLELESENNTATVSEAAVKSNENVVIILAAFRSGKLVGVVKADITPVNGSAVLAAPLTINSLQSGDEVHAFVWNKELKPFTMSDEVVNKITIE